MPSRRALRVLLTLLAACAAWWLAAAPAQAATRTVTLGPNGPSPSSLTIVKGDVVRFVNSDSVSHTVTHTSGAWTFTATIAAGAHQDTSPFSAAGTFGYQDQRSFVLPMTASGSIVVTAPRPSPSTSPRATASPKASPRPGPGASAA
ncbi:MAG: hypothetical protein WCD35_04615, partial [Mycobacteriales bacterium]